MKRRINITTNRVIRDLTERLGYPVNYGADDLHAALRIELPLSIYLDVSFGGVDDRVKYPQSAIHPWMRKAILAVSDQGIDMEIRLCHAKQIIEYELSTTPQSYRFIEEDVVLVVGFEDEPTAIRARIIMAMSQEESSSAA